jgi:hypothetical protein
MGVVQDFDNKFNTPLLNSVKYTTETDDAHPITKLLQEYGQMWVDCLNANIDKKQLIQTGELKQSIKYDPRIARGKVFVLKLLIADYYKFVDQGVKGAVSSAKAPNSPFKYGSGKGKKGGLREGMIKWVREKNLGGLKAEVNLESWAGYLAYKIYMEGKEPTYFYSDCITEESVNELRQKLAQQVKQDMINLWR